MLAGGCCFSQSEVAREALSEEAVYKRKALGKALVGRKFLEADCTQQKEYPGDGLDLACLRADRISVQLEADGVVGRGQITQEPV